MYAYLYLDIYKEMLKICLPLLCAANKFTLSCNVYRFFFFSFTVVAAADDAMMMMNISSS